MCTGSFVCAVGCGGISDEAKCVVEPSNLKVRLSDVAKSRSMYEMSAPVSTNASTLKAKPLGEEIVKGQ
jgi:hypothetical protein